MAREPMAPMSSPPLPSRSIDPVNAMLPLESKPNVRVPLIERLVPLMLSNPKMPTPETGSSTPVYDAPPVS